MENHYRSNEPPLRRQEYDFVTDDQLRKLLLMKDEVIAMQEQGIKTLSGVICEIERQLILAKTERERQTGCKIKSIKGAH